MEGTWDLLCVLDLPNRKGKVQTVEEYKMDECLKNGKTYNPPPPRPPEHSSHEQLDLKFVSKLLSGTITYIFFFCTIYRSNYHISIPLFSAIENHVSEDWVKLQFYEYTQQMVLQASDEFHLNHFHERRMDSEICARYDANKYRVRLVKQSSEFLAMPSNPWVWSEDTPSIVAAAAQIELERTRSHSDLNYIDGDTLLSQLTRLQVETDMDDTDVAAIFSILNRGMQTEPSFQVLLSLLPESRHGLHPITSGLFHPSPSVRKHSVRLLQRMEMFFSTRPAFTNMNKFIKHAFERQVQLQEEQAKA